MSASGKHQEDAMTSQANVLEEKDATIERLHEQISVLQQEINQYQEFSFKVEEELQHEGLQELLEVGPDEQILFLLKERSLILEDLDKAHSHISELEEQKVILENMVEEFEMEKHEMGDAMTLYKQKAEEELEGKETDHQSQLNALRTELQQLGERNTQLENMLNQYQESNEGGGGGVVSSWESDKLRNELKELREKLGHSRDRETRLEEEIELSNDKLKTTRRDAQQANQMVTNLEANIQDLNAEMEEVIDQLEEKDIKIKDLMQENASLIEKTQQLATTNKSPIKQVGNHEKLEKAMQEIELKNSSIAELRSENEKFSSIIGQQKAELERLSEDYATEIADLKEEIEKLTSEKETKTKSNVDNLTQQLEESTAWNNELRRELSESQEANRQLKNLIVSGDSGSRDKVESKLKSAREELEKNREYIAQLEVQLDDAKRECQRQNRLHEETQYTLNQKISDLKQKLTEHMNSLPSTPTPEQGQPLVPKTDLISTNQSLKLSILNSAERVIVCQTKALKFATVFECGKHISYT